MKPLIPITTPMTAALLFFFAANPGPTRIQNQRGEKEVRKRSATDNLPGGYVLTLTGSFAEICRKTAV